MVSNDSHSASDRTPLLRNGSESQSLAAAPAAPELQAESYSVIEDEIDGLVAFKDDVPTKEISSLQGCGIVFSLGLLIFLQASNISLLTTVQGVIAEELDAYESTIWFTSAYLVAMSSISPVMGRLSYIIAPRIVMFFSAMVLAIGALVTGLAPSLAVFLAGRAITGTGAAGVLSIAIILVIELVSTKRRGLWIGILNSGFTVGVAFGAVFAGLLEPAFGWRALFWIQSPLSFLGGIGLLASIPVSLRNQESQTVRQHNQHGVIARLARIDYVGAALLVGTITSLLYGLSTSPVHWPSIAISFSLLPVFLLQETYRHPDPIVPVTILRSRAVLLSNLSTLGFMMARWAILFYSPMYALAVREWSPATAGSILVPTNAGFALGGLLSGGLHIRGHRQWWGASVTVYALFALTQFALAIEATNDSSTWVVVLWIFCNGLCAGAALNYTLQHLLYLVTPDVSFIATSLLATFRGFAGTFGSAIGGGIFIRVLRRSLSIGFDEIGTENPEGLIRRLIGSPRAVQLLHGAPHDVAVNAYTSAVQTLFYCGAGLSVVMLLAQAGTGWTAPPYLEADADADAGET